MEGIATPNGVVSQSIATTVEVTYVLQFDVGVTASNTSEQRLEVAGQGAGVLVSDTVSMFGLGSGEPRVENGGFTLIKVKSVLQVLNNRHRKEPASYWSAVKQL